MKRFCFLIALALLTQCQSKDQTSASGTLPSRVKMSKPVLKDKLKGGWAGQVIGVTFGSPVEFRFNGTMINDYQPLPWYDGYIAKTMRENPGVYDDLYMDLTFVDVFEQHGLDAPVNLHAQAYANAAYPLWHANQAGRYNLLHGIPAARSGYWLNNPHADDIDFQIESDFAGLMSPGMPNTAAQIGDSIGHIMNYGDGWYGGVFVSAMYSMAYVQPDIRTVVESALKMIPSQSTFHQCIADVIRWHEQYPNDWKQTWFEIQKKWSSEIGCPDGVFQAFNIDAKINAAYVTLGLLYGNGDYGKTLEITARAGQDADCNPSTAGGILGTLLGYGKIPEYWKQGLASAEDIDFRYTTMSLKKVYEIGFQHALNVITMHGGDLRDTTVTIAVQAPEAVRFEQSFLDLTPTERRTIHQKVTESFHCSFEGTGVTLGGEASLVNRSTWGYDGKEVIIVSVSIDGGKPESIQLPVSFHDRRHELFWKYQLPQGSHTLDLIITQQPPNTELTLGDLLVFSASQQTKK